MAGADRSSQEDRRESTRYLQALGLRRDEADTYLAIVDGPKTPAEIATVLNINLDRATTLLDELVTRGLANRLPGEETRYGMTSPEWVFPTLIRHREEEIEGSRRLARELEQKFRAFESGIPVSNAYVEIVGGVEATLAQTHRIQSEAKKEILGFVKEPILSLDNAGEEVAAKRGVRNRWLWERSFLEKPGMIEVARDYAAMGEEIRVVSVLPSKLLIIDGEIAIVHVTELTGSEPLVAGLATRHPELIATFTQLFELLWRSSIPVFEGLPAVSVDENPQREELLGCLTAGLTDGAIARQLGISPRTLTRRIQEILDELGVETRFQAGYRLGSRATERT